MGICESCCRADEGESSHERVSLLRDGGSSSSGHGGGAVASGDGFSSVGSSGSASGGGSNSSVSRDNNAGSTKANKEKLAAQYYQSIIDEANSKFISSSSYRTPKNRREVSLGGGSGVEEWRIRLAAAKVNLSLLRHFDSHGRGVAGLCLAASDKLHNMGSSNSSSSNNSSSVNSRPSSLHEQVVLDILNEPVVIASQLEVVIDEIAELVASNALRFRVEEGGDSSLVSKFSIL